MNPFHTGRNGYSPLVFAKRPEDKYMCELCTFVLRRAVQSLCGHRYCEKCFRDLFRYSNTEKIFCKACENENYPDSELRETDMFPDRAISRELGNHRVKCINEGCGWKGIFRDYEQSHTDSCDFEMILCDREGCRTSVQRRNFKDHRNNQCEMRMVSCTYCKTDCPQKFLKSHQEECPEYPVECQFCRSVIHHRKELRRHQDPEQGDCPRKLATCKYKLLGCNTLVEEEKLEDHCKQSIVAHQDLIRDHVVEIAAAVEDAKKDRIVIDGLDKQTKTQANQIKELEGTLRVCEEKVRQSESNHPGHTLCATNLQSTVEPANSKLDELNRKCAMLESKIGTYEGIVAVLNSQIERDAQQLRTFERQRRQDRELLESLERKIKAQDRIIALKDVALAEQDLRIQSLEMTSYDGILIWKITDCTRKLNEARSGKTSSIYSPCFFTSRHGYKMCARIYLNGDGMGKGNHVSLFFVIMKGPYDALLRWPFRQKVTFMWLDQNNREHVIDAFRPDPSSTSFQRPKNDMNIASGCPLFMPLSQIDSSRHAYVKDDTAFLKIIVDTSDLS